MRKVSFTKIQSTGNDFVVIDYDSVNSAFFDNKHIQKVCQRNFGIGADGVIALQKLQEYAFRFHYYNADGSRAAMCGNGLRAAMRFALDNKWIAQKHAFRFLADDGVHQGSVNGNLFKADILVNDVITEITLSDFNLPQWIKKGYSINTGVPHLVLICSEKIRKKEIKEIGKELRFHDKFKPHGTNVNFVELMNNNRCYIRTYERGVEEETLSCGTGVTAAALVLKSHFNYLKDIDIKTNGGNLKVTVEKEHIFINGPSESSFKGELEI